MKMLLATALAAGVFASATSQGLAAKQEDWQKRVDKMKIELQLTPDQVTKIQQIFVETYGPKEKVKAMSEADRKAYMKSKQPEVQAKLKAVLTAEQVAKLKEMKKNR